METDFLNRNDDSRRTSAVDPAEDCIQSIQDMSPSELELMQTITLHQMKEAPAGAELLILGRVWYRLEQERRRRKADEAILEQMYFAR